MGKTYEELRDRVIEDVNYARDLIIQGDIIDGLALLTGLTDSLENEKELNEHATNETV